MRKPSRKTLIKNLDEVCRELALERDGNRCVKCGVYSEGGYGLHASHIVPKQRGYHVRWVLDNIKILCAGCHLWWHKDPLAGIWLKDVLLKHDKVRYDRIKSINKDQRSSFKQNDLIELLEKLQAQRGKTLV